MQIRTNWIGILGVLLYLNSCYNSKGPSVQIEKVAIAELAIIKAQDSRAYEFAAHKLRKAKEKWQNAKKALQDKNYEEAARLAEQALVDANLAEAQAEFEMVRQNVLGRGK